MALLGCVPSTGASTQAMSSYLPEEIYWGYRFDRIVTNQREDGKFLFDYKGFHDMVPVDTPVCSAADFHAMNEKKNSLDSNGVSHRSVGLAD